MCFVAFTLFSKHLTTHAYFSFLNTILTHKLCVDNVLLFNFIEYIQEPSAGHGLNPNAEVWPNQTFSLAEPNPGFSQDQVSWLDHPDGLHNPEGRWVMVGWGGRCFVKEHLENLNG